MKRFIAMMMAVVTMMSVCMNAKAGFVYTVGRDTGYNCWGDCGEYKNPYNKLREEIEEKGGYPHARVIIRETNTSKTYAEYDCEKITIIIKKEIEEEFVKISEVTRIVIYGDGRVEAAYTSNSLGDRWEGEGKTYYTGRTNRVETKTRETWEENTRSNSYYETMIERTMQNLF